MECYICRYARADKQPNPELRGTVALTNEGSQRGTLEKLGIKTLSFYPSRIRRTKEKLVF